MNREKGILSKVKNPEEESLIKGLVRSTLYGVMGSVMV